MHILLAVLGPFRDRNDRFSYPFLYFNQWNFHPFIYLKLSGRTEPLHIGHHRKYPPPQAFSLPPMSSYCCGWGSVILVSALTDHSAEFPSLLNNGKPLLELVFPVFANLALTGWRWITFLTTVITGLAFSWSELGGVALWDGVGAVVFWGGTVVSSYFASWLREEEIKEK